MSSFVVLSKIVNVGFKFQDDTTKLIWAYSNEDVQNESEIQKHINKGSKNVMLLQPSQSKDVPFDFTINITLQNVFNANFLFCNHILIIACSTQMSIPGNQDTFYACKIFRLPDLPKAHVVKVVSENLLQAVNFFNLRSCFTVSTCDTSWSRRFDL